MKAAVLLGGAGAVAAVEATVGTGVMVGTGAAVTVVLGMMVERRGAAVTVAY